MNQKIKRIRQILVVLVLLASIGGLSSCVKYSFTPPAVDKNATWHFQTDIQPIFTANCVTCHGSARTPDLRDGKSFLSLTKGGYVSLPAESSKLYLKMTSTDHSPRSTDAEKLKVLYWITQGALNN
jgi:hypothetical protein